MDRIDRFITACSGWATFWDALNREQPVLPGKAFERLTQLYLRSHPEYRTQLRHVWRVPDEVPVRVRQRLGIPTVDEGIDLLAETNDGEFWAIQCKFRSATNRPLTYGELSTFTSLAFVTCKDISLAVVAHTCSKPVRKHKYLGNATEIGLDRWLGLTDEDWRGIQGQIAGKTVSLMPRMPRPHQEKVIDAARAHFTSASRGRMVMPCGTGKSLTAFWIARELDAKSIVVAVPSLALIRQSLLDWTREYLAHGEVPQWLVVCSDETTAKLDRDEFVGDTYDLGIPTTTKRDDIVTFLRKRTGRRIVFTTYQSSDTLAEAAREAGVTIDLAVLDEAHKTVGVKSKAFATLLSDTNIHVRHRLFMTATERVLRGENDDVFSMDDEATYGKRFHQLTFKDAIAQQIISDYRILTITVSDAAIRDLIAENRFIDVEGDETDAQALAAAVALRRTFERHGVTHAISFHRSIKAASTFSDRQSALDEVTESSLTSLHVSSKKSTGERAELMRQFVSEERALITNARCLTEGVDVPAIDCVLFADPKRSVVDIVQAAGRALRPYPGKQFGYILLPLMVPSGMEMNEFAETTEFKHVARTITALSTQDERIAEQFRVVELGRKSGGKIVEIEGDVQLGAAVDLDAFAEQVGTKLWERIGRANWRPFEDARAYVRSLRLRSYIEYRAFYVKNRRFPPDIPTNPNVIYADKGWTTWGDWLGTGSQSSRGRKYLPFDEARNFVHELRLASRAEWRDYATSLIRPANIPSDPARAYRNSGWKGFGDWLGTGSVRPGDRKYLPFNEARKFAHALQLKSWKEWREYGKSGRLPDNIPANPRLVYAKHGWTNVGDWLGTGRVASQHLQYWPYAEARSFVHELGLGSFTEWRSYAKTVAKPPSIPADPRRTYLHSGWSGWGDWLGTGTIASRNRTYRPFEDARVFAHTLKLASMSRWQEFSREGNLPPDIPSHPERAYRRKGWEGWGDWLGTGNATSRERLFLSYLEAREAIRGLKLTSVADWECFCKSGKLPANIPAAPEYIYRGRGWIGFGDWLGTGRTATIRRTYLPFSRAREYARKLGLRGSADWFSLAKTGKLPNDIPSTPGQVYRDKGWVSWPDWLGTDTTRT